jgi:hypothetical protein
MLAVVSAVLAGCAETGKQAHIMMEGSDSAAYRLSKDFTKLDAIKAATRHCKYMGRKAVLRRSDATTAAFDCK